MSQQKVDQHKKEKYNRKQIMRKQKREQLLMRICGTVFALAIVGWIGFSVYNKIEASQPVSYTEVDMDALTDYISGLN